MIVWTYEVAPGAEQDFIVAYGPDGAWARLFAKGEGFESVALLRDGERRFLSLDHWRSEAAFDAFQAQHGGEYRALDAALAHLTRAQTRVGAFVRL